MQVIVIVRHSILFSLIIFVASYCYGQTYDSLIKPGKTWDRRCRHASEPSYFSTSVKVLYDTLNHKGKSYYRMAFVHSFPFDSTYVREEGKRVWFLNLDEAKYKREEILMYDFNLEQGDTFNFKHPSRFHKDSILTEIAIVKKTYIKDSRRYIEFDRMMLPSPWIEGLGLDQWDLCYAFYDGYFTEYSCGLCVFENQKQVYPVSGICDSSSFGIQEVKGITIKLFPNPAQKIITIQLNNTSKYIVQLVNLIGEKVDEFELEGKESYSLSCNYPRGMYLIRIINGKSNFKAKIVLN